jgi:hypothetical protein
MSQSSTNTSYSLYVSDSNGDQIFATSVNGSAGMDDATWLSLVETLRDFAWPAAMRPVLVQASKSESVGTYYNCDTVVTPPTFN